MSACPVDILMYHSLSEGDGPPSISQPIFREQMGIGGGALAAARGGIRGGEHLGSLSPGATGGERD